MAVVRVGNGSCLPHEGRRGHRPVALAAALALIGALSIVAPTSASAAVPPTATFNPNLLLKGSNSAAEPSIRTDRFGRSFVIAPTGVPAGCKAFRVTPARARAAYTGQPGPTAGGGDCRRATAPPDTSSPIAPTPPDQSPPHPRATLTHSPRGT